MRAEVLRMEKTADIAEVVRVIWEELTAPGLEISRARFVELPCDAAPGSLRPVLRLSLSRPALEDPEAAIAAISKIPEEDLAQFTSLTVGRSIAASRGFPKAIDLMGEAIGQTLSNTWLRHDKEAAEEWREARWIFY